MITDSKKWHLVAVKGLSALLKGVISKHDGWFYCLNCCHSNAPSVSLKIIIMYVKIMIIVMLKCLKKIIKY